jgi:hypothetical protein
LFLAFGPYKKKKVSERAFKPFGENMGENNGAWDDEHGRADASVVDGPDARLKRVGVLPDKNCCFFLVPE